MRAKFGLVPTGVSKILSFKFISRYSHVFLTHDPLEDKLYAFYKVYRERLLLIIIYLIIRRCARTGAFPGAFCVPNSVALASPTLWGVQWAIH